MAMIKSADQSNINNQYGGDLSAPTISQNKWINIRGGHHQGEFSLVASIKVKFLASVTKNVVLSF